MLIAGMAAEQILKLFRADVIKNKGPTTPITFNRSKKPIRELCRIYKHTPTQHSSVVERPRKIPRTMPEEHNDGESETTCEDDNFPTEAGNNVNVEEAHRGEESLEDDTLPTMTAIAAGGQSSEAELQMLQKAIDAIVSKEGNTSVSLILKRVNNKLVA